MRHFGQLKSFSDEIIFLRLALGLQPSIFTLYMFKVWYTIFCLSLNLTIWVGDSIFVFTFLCHIFFYRIGSNFCIFTRMLQSRLFVKCLSGSSGFKNWIPKKILTLFPFPSFSLFLIYKTNIIATKMTFWIKMLLKQFIIHNTV